jgi:RNA polymerase sigma factor (sigma-70 family)
VIPSSARQTSAFSSPSIHASCPRCPWEDFVQRYQRPLRARVVRALWSAGRRPADEQVDDLVQDVYCRLLDAGGRRVALCRGAGEEAMAAYLGRIAERVVADQLRRTRALKRGRCRLLAAGLGGGEEALARAIDPRGTPEDALLAAERRRNFLDVCRRLLPGPTAARDTRVLELALLGGWSSQEIARVLGGRLAASSIDSLVCRLRRRLAETGIPVPKRDCRPHGPRRRAGR